MIDKVEEKLKQMIELGIPFVKDPGKEHPNANYTSSLLTPTISIIVSLTSSYNISQLTGHNLDVTMANNELSSRMDESNKRSKKQDRDELSQLLKAEEYI
ncbi:2256_t:CDS:2, partial [Acaulospora colombiana]